MQALNMSLPNGIICTPEEYQQSLTDRTITHYAAGLMVVVDAGSLSLITILYLFTIIIRSVIWRLQHVCRARLGLFHHPMEILIFSLICADTFQAIGMVLNLKCIMTGKSEVGNFCTLQGVINFIGATSVALSTLAITIYTFLGVWMTKTISSMRITLGVVLVIWIFDAILVIIKFVFHPGDGKLSYMVPVPSWASPLEWEFLTEYMWMGIMLLLSVLIYIPLYLWMRGNLVIDEAAGWNCHFKQAINDDSSSICFRQRQSVVMLAYPLVYCFGILVMGVARWIQFVQVAKYGTNDVSSAVVFVGDAVFGLNGFLNVILLITTRPESGLFGWLMFLSPTGPPSIIEPDQGISAEMEGREKGYGIDKLPSGYSRF